MRIYHFESRLTKNAYTGIAFNKALTGFKNDYTRVEQFINNVDNTIFYLGKTSVNYIAFRTAVDMSHSEIKAFFKTWSAINIPIIETKPKRKKKVV